MTFTPVPPSGDQHEISLGEQRAVVASVGGGLRTYDVGGAAVLDGYAVDAMADGARAQTLVPWPNRVKDGAWTWQGEAMQLAITEPEQHNAIHGLVRWLPWRVVEQTATALSLDCISYPQPGYPWPLQVRNDYVLDEGGLTTGTTITNLGASAAPVAAGFHPYQSVGTDLIDDALLHLPADTWLPTGEQQIPTGREPVEGSPYDFRSPRPIGAIELDYTYTDLHRDDDGRFQLRLSRPDGSRAATFWLGPAYGYVEIFTGHALPEANRRRRGLGVEPMTVPPNGLATGESVVVVEPGESWQGEWGIRPE
ncbi:MAG: aldose 1-epimerase [Frankiaceae bacterium]|nr:aldose 1-epimerase [Frankiaceae bacterium]